MIWMFEGGPWDGRTLEILDDVPAPPHQVVTPAGGPEVHYWLTDVRDPCTFVYAPSGPPYASDPREAPGAG